MTGAQKCVLIVGAGSAIGRATALEYAAAGWCILLAARDIESARRTGDDVAVRRDARVSVHRYDVLDLEGFPAFVDSLGVLPDTVVCVVGEVGHQSLAQTDTTYAARVLRANFEGPALLLGAFGEAFLPRNSGAIVGVSSVAGDRGRGANYVYGSAKAGLSAFLSGLRSRVAGTGLRVVTVKPGFVRTRMTSARTLPGLLTAEPSEVGRAIFRAAEGRRAREVIYVRKVWRLIMLVIRCLPESMFKRMKF